MNRVYVCTVLATLALTHGCAGATEAEGEPKDENYTATCTQQQIDDGRVNWLEAHSLALKLPRDQVAASAQLEEIGNRLRIAAKFCSYYERALYDQKVERAVYDHGKEDGVVALFRSSGAALALAVKGAAEHKRCDQDRVLRLAYATTSTNPAYKKFIQKDAWAWPLHYRLGMTLEFAELDGTVDPSVHDRGVHVEKAFGDVGHVIFWTRKDASGVRTKFQLDAGHTFSRSRFGTTPTGSYVDELVTGEWSTSTPDGVLTLSSRELTSLATLRRTQPSQEAPPEYTLQVGNVTMTSFDLEGCE